MKLYTHIAVDSEGQFIGQAGEVFDSEETRNKEAAGDLKLLVSILGNKVKMQYLEFEYQPKQKE